MTIGERIKHRRNELGLSVDELAALLKKNRATIYRYESNEIEKLPTTVLEPLSKALQVSPGYFMGWEDEPSAPVVTAPEQTENEKLSFALYGTADVDAELLDDVRKYAEIARRMREEKKEG